MRYGAIEAGGTKFVCAVSDENFNILDQAKFDTETPEKTMDQVYAFFDQHQVDAIGIGSFGPIDIKEASDTYGYITSTPKPNWSHYDFLGAMKKRYDLPYFWTTDVNASCYDEYRLGSARELDSCLYLTVGTGVGGAVYKGELLTGRSHLEMGHLMIRRHDADSYRGHCPYHGDCLEGLVCGPAIEARFDQGTKAKDIDPDDRVWEYAAYYLAQALHNYSLTLMPEQIILGGGVMKQPQLFPLVRRQFKELWGDYLPLPDLEAYIVPPKLQDEAGITGCLLLAERALRES